MTRLVFIEVIMSRQLAKGLVMTRELAVRGNEHSRRSCASFELRQRQRMGGRRVLTVMTGHVRHAGSVPLLAVCHR